MRFLALLKKELREALPWLLLAAVALIFFGSISIRTYSQYWRDSYEVWHQGPSPQNPDLNIYQLREQPFLRDAATILFCTSIGLGIILAARQFLVPLFFKTWAFTIHRSISRTTLLMGKFTAAIITLILSCGIVWTLFWWYASRPGVLPMPPRTRTLVEGWLFVAAGLVVYFGTVLCALSTVRWYTTRIVGLAFATCILFFTLSQTSLALCIAMIAVGLVILVLQVVHTFLKREF
jgi:hypothetical protein